LTKKLFFPLILCAAAGLAFLIWSYVPLPTDNSWDSTDIRLIKSLSLSALPELAKDPSNSVGDLESAAEFGQALFFDQRLSGNGSVACASCHKPELSFTDGLELATGTAVGPRHTPSLLGISYSPWFYWDGRKDSQWSQALAPLEAGHEHNTDRTTVAQLISQDKDYRNRYESIFGPLPSTLPNVSATPLGKEAQVEQWNSLATAIQVQINTVFTNAGKALAAYQRKIVPGHSRFDDFADSLNPTSSEETNSILSSAEIAGLSLFIDKGQCTSCHNGPLFTNHEFHNTGVMAIRGELPPMARYDGVRIARLDPFNCLGEYSDAQSNECTELRFARDENELVGAQKTPTLRNISETAPYMHGGQIKTLNEVVRHYNDAPTSMLSHNEAKPLGLRPFEIKQLEAFLMTLTAPLATATKWLNPPK
jgi:cytochrome c peroxidase